MYVVVLVSLYQNTYLYPLSIKKENRKKKKRNEKNKGKRKRRRD